MTLKHISLEEHIELEIWWLLAAYYKKCKVTVHTETSGKPYSLLNYFRYGIQSQSLITIRVSVGNMRLTKLVPNPEVQLGKPDSEFRFAAIRELSLNILNEFKETST